MSKISSEYIITGIVVKLSCDTNESNSTILQDLAVNPHDFNDTKGMMYNDCFDADINFLT